MLRYVSSTEGTTATLGTEMEYAESYLAAMRARFGGSLEYAIDVSRDMRQIVVPRLILQPFIENCFKYGTSARPPWRIELRGGCDGRALDDRDPRQRTRVLPTRHAREDLREARRPRRAGNGRSRRCRSREWESSIPTRG